MGAGDLLATGASETERERKRRLGIQYLSIPTYLHNYTLNLNYLPTYPYTSIHIYIHIYLHTAYTHHTYLYTPIHLYTQYTYPDTHPLHYNIYALHWEVWRGKSQTGLHCTALHCTARGQSRCNLRLDESEIPYRQSYPTYSLISISIVLSRQSTVTFVWSCLFPLKPPTKSYGAVISPQTKKKRKRKSKNDQRLCCSMAS